MSKQSKRHMGLEVQGDLVTSNSLMFRNRIINGDMRIDQRNAGNSVTITGEHGYSVDRMFIQAASATTLSFQQSSVVPVGFNKSLSATVSVAKTPVTADANRIMQRIEGFNVADLGWGTANAKTITLSFWVRSSVVGTHSGGFTNSASNRSYVFTYTISAANTWEQKTITVPGDTSGTWATDDSTGIELNFNLGSGPTYLTASTNTWNADIFLAATGAVSVCATANATFYVTGVQLEAGSSASAFEHRPYGMELALCQRYFQIMQSLPGSISTLYGPLAAAYQATRIFFSLPLLQTMRRRPTITSYSLIFIRNPTLTQSYLPLAFFVYAVTEHMVSIEVTPDTNFTPGSIYVFSMATNGHIHYDAEL